MLADHPLLQQEEIANPTVWSLEKMQACSVDTSVAICSRRRNWQAYISYVKGIDPAMTPECEAVLTKYYQVWSACLLNSKDGASNCVWIKIIVLQLQRKADGRTQARTTVRLLESMVRLTQVCWHEQCSFSLSLFFRFFVFCLLFFFRQTFFLLCQAHARLMCRPQVSLQDAICAIITMESTLQVPGQISLW